MPDLPPGVERVFYLPISGSGPAVEAVRLKETGAIQRFLRSRRVASEVALVPADAAELYHQVEPYLMMEARAEACAGLEESTPDQVLEQGIALFLSGDQEESRKALAAARTQLPCARKKLSRGQLAELLAWSGITHALPVSEEAQGFLQGALATDPLIVENARIPESGLRLLKRAAGEGGSPPAQVDVHIPQEEEGEHWAHTRLMLDGRRLVLDKLFVQVPAGTHYLQVSLDEETSWGALIQVKAGDSPDLARLARESLRLRERYRLQLERTLATGALSPGVAQGFKVYLAHLRRDQFFLTALTLEADGTWITLRRFHRDRGIEVPDFSRQGDEQVVTASVPLPLNRAGRLSVGLVGSSMQIPRSETVATGAGLGVEGDYVLKRGAYVGADLTIGGRKYELLNAAGETVERGDLDVVLSPRFGYSVPLKQLEALVDLGYGAHLNPVRGLRIPCRESFGTDYDYACGYDLTPSDSTVTFNLRGFAHGPRARVGLRFLSRPVGSVTLQGLARVGYSARMVSFQPQETVTVRMSSDEVEDSSAEVTLNVAESSRFQLLHVADVFLGLSGRF